MITLEADDHGFKCPHCGKGWCVDEWGTEYNDPVRGISTVRCLTCNKDFKIEVYIEIVVHPVPVAKENHEQHQT